MRLFLSAALLATIASPLAAAGLAETHREVAVPAGKINARAFAPVKQQPCVASATNPSGNRVLATLPARSVHGCQELASNDTATRR